MTSFMSDQPSAKILSSEPTHSHHSAFADWDVEQPNSHSELLTIFRSLVQIVKGGHPFDDVLTRKVDHLLKTIGTTIYQDPHHFILGLVPSSADESAMEFVSSVAVLTSSSNNTIITSTLRMVTTLIRHTSPKLCLSLINLNLIPQLLAPLNPQSLSFAGAPGVVPSLLAAFIHLIRLTSPHILETLEIEHHLDRNTVHQTVLQHILVPSGAFIRHLCLNHHSFDEEMISLQFVSLLAQIIRISPSHPQTMHFIQTLPVLLSIPNFLTSCPSDLSKMYCLSNLIVVQSEWNEQEGSIGRSGTIVTRFLTREGFSDVLEQMLMTDKAEDNGGCVVVYSITLSDLLGVNCRQR